MSLVRLLLLVASADALTMLSSIRHSGVVQARGHVRAQADDGGGLDLNAAFANAVKKTQAEDKAKREKPLNDVKAKLEDNKRAKARRELGFEVRHAQARPACTPHRPLPPSGRMTILRGMSGTTTCWCWAYQY